MTETIVSGDEELTVIRDPFAAVDPIGEALHFFRMSGTFYCPTEVTAPWGLTMPAMPNVLFFHVVTSGSGQLVLDGEPVIELRQGDLALVAHGRGHVAQSEAGVSVPSVLDLPHEHVSDRYAILRHGGGGEMSRFVCGAVQFEHPAAQHLVDALPAVVVVRADSDVSEWTSTLLRLIGQEARAVRPGGEAVVSRLCDVLVVHAIRSWIATDPAAQRGWLGALHDPVMGRVIAKIHDEPGGEWSVASLAELAAMSRSAFAARFSELVGEAPMEYVTDWRMHIATNMLASDTVTVAEVARHVGYGSEAAFARAYKRRRGVTPGAVRRQAAADGA